MIGDSGHRRRGLPRTEEEAHRRAAEPSDEKTQEPTDEAAPPGLADQPGDQARPPAQTDAAAHSPSETLPERHRPAAPLPAQNTSGAHRRTGLGGTPVPRPASAPAVEEESTPEPALVTEPSPVPEPEPAPAPAPARATATAAAPPAERRGVNRTVVWTATGLGGVVLLAALLVLGAQWFVGTGAGQQFLERYPGQYAQPDAPGGYPWWLNWAHFFNAFLMVLVIKTGIQIRRETKPEAYWTPKWNRKRRISLTIWTHNTLDLLWVINGVVFVVLLAVTGYWTRVVPTSWEVLPNALSAVLQYIALDWPTAGEWAHYNSAQELAYFSTIFIAAPLAIATGVRMSGLWPEGRQSLNTVFPLPLARAVHFPVMIYFVVFIAVHLILVFATDALRNLNQIYTGQDATNWTGFWLFVLSLIVIIGGVLATRATIMAPVASLFGRVGR